MKNTNRFPKYSDNAVVIELTDEELDDVTGGNSKHCNDHDHDHDHDHHRYDDHCYDRHRHGHRY